MRTETLTKIALATNPFIYPLALGYIVGTMARGALFGAFDAMAEETDRILNTEEEEWQ